MGAWNVGLYGSDTALDVKGHLETWLRIPGTADDIVRNMTGNAGGRFNETDEDYPDFWLALADRFHVYGLEHAETFRRARHVITSGLDLKVKKELELGAKDLKKREIVLAELLERWSKPPKKPLKRTVLKAPEPLTFAPGTIIAYPTCGGEAMNYADTKNRMGWKRDGWGSAIILAQGHEKGWFAWTCAGRLAVHGREKPTFEQCRASAIENQPWDLNIFGKGTRAVQLGALPPQHARRMEMEALGRVTLDASKAAGLCPDIARPKRVPLSTIHHVFTWWERGVRPLLEFRLPIIATPKPAVPLRSLLA